MEITKKYLLTLLSVKDIEKTVYSHLDNIMKYMLEYIGMNPSSSAYDCHKYLNEIGIKLLHEDVNVLIKNLIKLGLIQTVTNINEKNKNSIEDNSVRGEKSKNNTISYLISSAGIFYLFRTNPENIDIELILNNKEDGLFVNFLYPYLDCETLKKIGHIRTIMHINRFLGRCCETIQTVLEHLRTIQEKEGESGSIGYVDGLANPEYDDGFYGPRGFIQGLKNILKIEWLDPDDTKIIEVEKNKL